MPRLGPVHVPSWTLVGVTFTITGAAVLVASTSYLPLHLLQVQFPLPFKSRRVVHVCSHSKELLSANIRSHNLFHGPQEAPALDIASMDQTLVRTQGGVGEMSLVWLITPEHWTPTPFPRGVPALTYDGFRLPCCHKLTTSPDQYIICHVQKSQSGIKGELSAKPKAVPQVSEEEQCKDNASVQDLLRQWISFTTHMPRTRRILKSIHGNDYLLLHQKIRVSLTTI